MLFEALGELVRSFHWVFVDIVVCNSGCIYGCWFFLWVWKGFFIHSYGPLFELGYWAYMWSYSTYSLGSPQFIYHLVCNDWEQCWGCSFCASCLSYPYLWYSKHWAHWYLYVNMRLIIWYMYLWAHSPSFEHLKPYIYQWLLWAW